MKVLVAAGASGGHVYPALATAIVLRDLGHDVEFAGGDRIESRVVPEAGFPFHPLAVERPPSVRRELLSPRGIRAMTSIGLATLRARGLVRRIAPDVVLGMGGFASVPVALAAGWGRPALVLHEQNAHLSLAQRLSLRRADVLAMGLPIEERVDHGRTELVGNPVRASIASLFDLDDTARATARNDAMRRLGLDPSLRTLVVIGGSLGSGPLNTVAPTLTLPAGTQVLHLAGVQQEEDVRRAWSASSAPVHVVGFSDSMEDVYLAADVALSRSGASTISEMAIAGLPAILVPLLTLQRGDQAANARVLERAGGAIVVQQSDERFAALVQEHVSTLLSDDAARARMRQGARSVARPDAARRLAEVVTSVRTPA